MKRQMRRSVLWVAILASPGCGQPTAATGPNTGGGGGNVASPACAPPLAPQLFANALCVCGDLVDAGNFVVRSAQSGPSGSVGVNGHSKVANHSDVSGSWVAYGGLELLGDAELGANLSTARGARMTGNVSVAGDLRAGQDLEGYGRLAVGGVLRVGGANRFIGYQETGAVAGFQSLSGPPCPCADGSIFDVAAAVALAKANNANATIGLPTIGIDHIGLSLLTLPQGAYFVSGVRTLGATRLRISGAVSLYLEGSLDQIGAEQIVIDPGATLDLYVSGSVKTVGYASLGAAADPSAFRLYVGGSDTLTLSVGAQWFNGSIYAPRAKIEYVGDTTIAGALFCDDLTGVGQLTIEADLPGGGGSCPSSPTPGQPPVTPTPPIY